MNKVILMGRLTKDPEMRYTNTNNIPVCSFSLAVERRFAKQEEEKQADFFPIVAWNKSAEFCSKYFTKGKKVVIVGRLQTRTWDDDEGKRHYITEVIAEETYFAESKKAEGSQMQQQSQQQQQEGQEGFVSIDDDDDFPF